MKSITEMQADEGFANWIDREWPDEKIFRLVYNCYKADIRTHWSNEGRVGQKLPGYSMHKAPEGFYVFDPGYIAYRRLNEPTTKFHELLEKVVRQNPSFARFNPLPKDGDPDTWFFLGFSDITQKANCLWTGKEIDVVEISAGNRRIEQIDKIWQFLTDETAK